jgi:hypothetical protein
VLREQRGRAIIIQMGDIPARDLDPDLRLALKSSVVIRWTDRMFWEKLRFFLPPGDGVGPVPMHHQHATLHPHHAAIQHYALPIYEVPHLPPGTGSNGLGLSPANGGTTTLMHSTPGHHQAILTNGGVNGTTTTLGLLQQQHNGQYSAISAGTALRPTHMTLSAAAGNHQQQKLLYHQAGGRTLDSHISAKIY